MPRRPPRKYCGYACYGRAVREQAMARKQERERLAAALVARAAESAMDVAAAAGSNETAWFKRRCAEVLAAARGGRVWLAAMRAMADDVGLFCMYEQDMALEELDGGAQLSLLSQDEAAIERLDKA